MAKSNYQLQIKGMRNKKRKQFNKNGGSKRWLKTRHRIRKKMLR